MHVLKTDFHGNPNVGLYAFCTDKYVLLGNEVPKHLHSQIEEVLQLKAKTISIAGTPLIGVFLAGNSTCTLVPSIAFESELEKLEKLGINYKVVETKLTCLGNNILCNDSFAILSPEFSKKDVEYIKQALGVKVEQKHIAGTDTPGSIAVMNSKACLLHHEADAKEIAYVSKKFSIPVEEGSVNMGSPYLKSGIIANNQGFIIGNQSGGPEIVHIEKTLGYLD